MKIILTIVYFCFVQQAQGQTIINPIVGINYSINHVGDSRFYGENWGIGLGNKFGEKFNLLVDISLLRNSYNEQEDSKIFGRNIFNIGICSQYRVLKNIVSPTVELSTHLGLLTKNSNNLIGSGFDPISDFDSLSIIGSFINYHDIESIGIDIRAEFICLHNVRKLTIKTE